jgi:peroxiredoxin Q/BCP
MTDLAQDAAEDPATPTVGDRAPDFTAPTGGGGTLHLGDLLGKKPIVLYFYPRDDTPGCTAEACAFRDQRAQFAGAGAEIIGVSADSAESHDRFASKYELPFTLVSDVDGGVRSRYGVAPHGPLPKRSTYVIDGSGVISGVFSSLESATQHVDRALEALAK